MLGKILTRNALNADEAVLAFMAMFGARLSAGYCGVPVKL